MLGSGTMYENIVTVPNIDHRAKIAYSPQGNLTLVYQSRTDVSVLQKQGDIWKTIFEHKVSISDRNAGSTHGPSFVNKNGSLYALYHDDTKVYLKKL